MLTSLTVLDLLNPRKIRCQNGTDDYPLNFVTYVFSSNTIKGIKCVRHQELNALGYQVWVRKCGLVE